MTGVRCGFIGLGDQGAPIARRMIDHGLPMLLWARRPETLVPFRDGSATIAPGIAELGAGAEHVAICVLDDNGVRDVCARLIPAMNPGSRIAIHSTVHPDTVKAVAADAAARGIALLDAPVSGGAPGARAGTITVMLGGDPAEIEAARPIFETFARLIVRVGDIGAGQCAKLINNTLLAANIATARNALLGGEKLGLDTQRLVEILRASSGQSFGMEVAGRMTAPKNFAHGAMVLMKDVRLLGELLGAGDPDFAPLRDAAVPFLKSAMD